MENLETNMPSILHIFSIGIAAENLPLNSKALNVTPLEKTSMTNGELTANATQQTVKVTDSVGASDEAKTTTSTVLETSWMPFGSNRFTPPNIRRGEKVLIWKQGDADIYYWSEYEYNADLRKLETVVYLFSNTRDENAKADSTNSVFLEVSTHNKLIHLRYNNSDGEPHAWDIQLNAKESIFIIKDDIDNLISIESQEKRIQIKNADDSSLTLDKKNGRLFIPENMDFEIGQNMSMKVGGNWDWSVVGNVTGSSAGAKYKIPDTSFSGNVNIAKMTNTGGFYSTNTESDGFKVNGRGVFIGGFRVEGDIHATGDITADGTIHN